MQHILAHEIDFNEFQVDVKQSEPEKFDEVNAKKASVAEFGVQSDLKRD